MKLKSDNNFGLSLRPLHYNDYLNKKDPVVGWLEIIGENYFRSFGKAREILLKIRENYPLSVHGVSLSIASYEEFDMKYLQDMKQFYQDISPCFISDHLAFTGLNNSQLHNLIPFAFNQENLVHLSERIDYVQNYFKRPMAFENLSAYFDYNSSTMSEWEFIKELLKKNECLMVLDLNNIFVNSKNHNFNPIDYIDSINLNQVQEIHLAGFKIIDNFLFDSHSEPIYPELINLYKYVLTKNKNIPVVYEWDENIPSFEILRKQIEICQAISNETI